MGYISARTPRDIEQLVVWALVDNGLGREFVMDRNGRMDWRDTGVIVDRGSSRASVALPTMRHEDAGRIAQAIAALPDRARALVVIHGRTNCRPDWCEEGVGREEAKTNRRGQVEYHYERPGDRHSRKLGPKLVWVGETPERVAWFREAYAVWWAALEGMVGPLNEVMTKYEAKGPAVAAEPWVTYGEGTALADAMAGDSLPRRAEIERVGPIDLAPPDGQNGNLQAGESASR